LKSLKIKTRLLIGFAAVIILAIIVCAVGLQGLFTVKNSYNISYTDSVNALQYVEGISSGYWEMYTQLFSALVSTSLGDREIPLQRIDATREEIKNNISNYKEMLTHYDEEEVAQEKSLLLSVEETFVAFDSALQKVIDDQVFNNLLRIQRSAGTGTDLATLGSELESRIHDLVEYSNNYTHEQIKSNEEVALQVIIIVAAGAAVAIIVGIVISISISRSLSKRLNLLVSASNNVAEGDVNVAINVDRNDELGEVARAFAKMIEAIRKQAYLVQEIADKNLDVDVEVRSDKDFMGKKLSMMVDGLNVMFTDIIAAAERVAASAKQMSDSSMALSQGATEQASTVEELTASLEEISSQTKNNAVNANKATEMSLTAKEAAAAGTRQMQEMLQAMDEISSSSNNINRIIKVIEDIAFQTNILALNAAVEAARAGQHGKGFAVVAEEVRNLAARSSSAAKETTALIEQSINKVAHGTKIATETSEALDKIVNIIDEISNVINEIAVASNEQSLGIEQINQGITQVSQVVQENSATAEETAAASEELSSQAETLRRIVNSFKLRKKVVRRKDSERTDEEDSTQKADAPAAAPEPADGTEGWEEDSEPGRGEQKPVIALSDSEFGKY